MTEEPLGRIWPCSGGGSLSGQYMMHGASGSLDTFCTRPPTLIARPDGVSSGYALPDRGPIDCAPPGTPGERGSGDGGCASAPGELCVRAAAPASASSGYIPGMAKPASVPLVEAKRGERRAMGGAR